MERFAESQTWLVVFDKAHGGMKWWHWFLHPAFRHIFLLRDMEGQCMMVNCLSHVMAVNIYPITPEALLKQSEPTAVLQYTTHYAAHYKPSPIEPLTCVSIAKRILAIRGPLTPKGLYHELIKAGAIVLKPYCIY